MKAFSKVNLFLEITGQRPDGYHDLINVFCPLQAPYDDISIQPASAQGIALDISGPVACPNDETNLCLKAARLFCDATGQPPAYTIKLFKRIPLAAGLGGGSSDAATTLRLLNSACANPLSPSELHGIAASLGADVPFFLNPQFALGTGKGDILSPFPISITFAVILVTPGFPLPVKWSFDHVMPDAAMPCTYTDFVHAASHDLASLASCTRNDLEPAVFQKFPMLCMMRETLLAAGALCVHVSGSGPSLFALAPVANAQAIAEAFSTAFPACAAPIVNVINAQP